MTTLKDRMHAAMAYRLSIATKGEKITRSALARYCGLSQPSISDWFSGETKSLRGASLIRAAAWFQVNQAWLSDGLGPMISRQGKSDIHAPDANLPIVATYNGQRATLRYVPVVGTARLGYDGYYVELEHPVGHGDGSIDYAATGDNVYALRVKGDSMHPVIRDGWYVVVDPVARCTPGEYVLLALTDGRKTIKELVYDRTDEVVVQAANDGSRVTVAKPDLEYMHAVASIVSPSRWRPE